MAAKSITKPLVWILMGLLILGLGGFGVTSLSGTLRTVGTVGEAEISVQTISVACKTRSAPKRPTAAKASALPRRSG